MRRFDALRCDLAGIGPCGAALNIHQAQLDQLPAVLKAHRLRIAQIQAVATPEQASIDLTFRRSVETFAAPFNQGP